MHETPAKYFAGAASLPPPNLRCQCAFRCDAEQEAQTQKGVCFAQSDSCWRGWAPELIPGSSAQGLKPLCIPTLNSALDIMTGLSKHICLLDHELLTPKHSLYCLSRRYGICPCSNTQSARRCARATPTSRR